MTHAFMTFHMIVHMIFESVFGIILWSEREFGTLALHASHSICRHGNSESGRKSELLGAECRCLTT